MPYGTDNSPSAVSSLPGFQGSNVWNKYVQSMVDKTPVGTTAPAGRTKMTPVTPKAPTVTTAAPSVRAGTVASLNKAWEAQSRLLRSL